MTKLIPFLLLKLGHVGLDTCFGFASLAQCCQERDDGIGVYRVSGQGKAGGKIGCEVGGNEHGGGVEEDDVPAGALFAGEDRAEDRGVVLGIAALKRGEGSAGKVEIFGSDGAESDDAVANFGHR